MALKIAAADRLRFYVKCAGAIALLNYFLFTRFHFSTPWFLCALLIAVGTPLLFAWFRIASGRPAHQATERGTEAPLSDKFLPAAEDGVFLLPLVFFGIDPITALYAATLYAIYQYRYHAVSYAFMLGVSYFVMAVWVLPEGLWMVVAGHAVATIVMETFFPPATEADFPEDSQPGTTP